MQITIALPGQPETAEPFTLRLVGEKFRATNGSALEYRVSEDSLCPLCMNRPPAWFADPASDAAMNPDASPLNAPEVCNPCLNIALQGRMIEIIDIDTETF